MGSPSLVVAHAPGSVANNALNVAGAVSGLPALSHTRNAELTACTYCVGPTAPVVSGGKKPWPSVTVSALEMPSNCTDGPAGAFGTRPYRATLSDHSAASGVAMAFTS